MINAYQNIDIKAKGEINVTISFIFVKFIDFIYIKYNYLNKINGKSIKFDICIIGI